MEKEQKRELAQAAPLHEVLLDMIVEKLPSAVGMISFKKREDLNLPHLDQREMQSMHDHLHNSLGEASFPLAEAKP